MLNTQKLNKTQSVLEISLCYNCFNTNGWSEEPTIVQKNDSENIDNIYL